MGIGRFDSTAWSSYTAASASKSRSTIFASRGLADIGDLNPKTFLTRECRDSAANPHSTPIIIAVDVTGSMGMLAEALVRRGIGTTFEEILQRAQDPTSGMVPDPHLMVLGIGDVNCDRAPIQATQFETDLAIAKQTEKMYLEGGGGGNNSESYDAAWYLAAMRTSTDAWEKRGEKGYLFTVGDESTPTGMRARQIRDFFGDEAAGDLSAKQLLTMAEERYHVFHLVVAQGDYAQRHGAENVKRAWQDLMGQRVLLLDDYTKLAEVIVSAIQVTNGASVASVTATWSGDTALVVARGLSDLAATGSKTASGVTRF